MCVSSSSLIVCDSFSVQKANNNTRGRTQQRTALPREHPRPLSCHKISENSNRPESGTGNIHETLVEQADKHSSERERDSGKGITTQQHETMSKALLSVVSIANSDSPTKEDDILSLLTAEAVGSSQLASLITAVTKQPTLPVKKILLRYVSYVEDELEPKARQQVYEQLVDLFTPPTALVSAALTEVVLNLSSLYESWQMFGQAVDLLHLLQADVLAQDFDDEESFTIFRVQLNTRIAKDCLQIDDYENAEAHLTRISQSLSSLPESASELRSEAHKTAVRVMIHVGKWLEAASRLLSLNDETCDGPLVTYALLAPSSPFTRNLFKEIRKSSHILSNVMNTPLASMFEKMSNERLIYAEEYTQVLSYIVEHNDQTLSDSYWQRELARAVVENNLVAASMIYANLRLSTFSEMVGLEQSSVESIITEMIRDDRMKASVDDINHTIYFGHDNALQQWQAHIMTSCAMLEKIVDDITFAS